MFFKLARFKQQYLVAIGHEGLRDALLLEAVDHLAAGPLLPHVLVFKVDDHVAVGPGLAENSIREPDLLLATHVPANAFAVLLRLFNNSVQLSVKVMIHVREHHSVVGHSGCNRN
jgi:hypothetical protein